MTYNPLNPNGPTTASNSMPVTLATDNNGPVKIYDGTNTANILKSDGTYAGQNSQLIAPAFKEVGSLTAGALNADLVPSTDVSGYATFIIQINGTWSGILSLQGSNDNSTFYSVYGTWANNTQPIANTASNGILSGSCNFRYFRVRMTTYTSGTATGTLELKTLPFAQTNTYSVSTVTSGANTTLAVPTSAYPAGYQARSTDITATTSTYNTIGITDLVGKQVVMPYAINQNFVNGATSITTITSTQLITAVTSNSIYLTSVQVMNTGSTTTYIALQDGSGGTTKAYVQAPAYGGSNITFPVPIKNTAGNAWYFAAGAATTIYISAQGYSGV